MNRTLLVAVGGWLGLLPYAVADIGSSADYACSVSDAGSVSLNELNSDNSSSNFDYVELKVLKDGTSIDGWELCASSSPKTGCWAMSDGTWYQSSPAASGAIPSSGATFAKDTWLVFNMSDSSGTLAQLSQNNGELLLLNGARIEGSSEVVDYLAYSKKNNCSDADAWTVSAACGVCFDQKDSSQKNLARQPDGSGDWGNNGNAATLGDNNNSGGAGGGTLDHFAISHDQSAVTCVSEWVTLTAHDADHNPIEPGTTTVALTTSTSAGQWQAVVAGGGVLSNNSGFDGSASYTFPAAGASSATLSFGYPVEISSTTAVNFNAVAGSVTELRESAQGEDPDLAVALTQLLFSTIPTQIAGKSSDQGWNQALIAVQAVKASDSDPSVCTALFGGSVTLELGAECRSAGGCTLPLLLAQDDGDLATATTTGSAIATSADDGGANTSAYTSRTLDFDAAAQSTLALQYPDAGLMQLHARYQLLDENGLASGAYLYGNSNVFAVRPFALGFSAIDDGGAPVVANPAGSAPAGNPFIPAGTPFQFDLGAYRYAAGEDADSDGIADPGVDVSDNGLTPSFAATAVVALGDITPVGGANGVVATTPVTISSNGIASNHSATYSEVGSLTLQAQVDDYLGVADADIRGSSAVIGRFYPQELVLLAGSSVVGSCNNVTYMDQPALSLDFTLEARNALGARTQHYDETLMGGAAALADLALHAENGGDGVDRGARISAVNSSWSAGRYQVLVSDAQFNRDANPDGPYDALQLSVGANDPLGDGFVLSGASGAPASVAIGSSTAVRYGRLTAENAYGPETDVLPQPLRVEFYQSGGFSQNGLDDCTAVATVVMNGSPWVAPAAVVIAPSGAATLPAFVQPDALGSGFQVIAGEAGLSYAAPGAGMSGSLVLEIDLSALPWLQYDWDEDGAPDSSMRPATATFGRYRGNDRMLFWQENFSR